VKELNCKNVKCLEERIEKMLISEPFILGRFRDFKDKRRSSWFVCLFLFIVRSV